MEEELDARPSEPLQDLHGTGDPDLRNLLRLLHNESSAGGLYGTLYTDSLTIALATRLAWQGLLGPAIARSLRGACHS
ncbi:hypothetical protein HDF13_000210 [Edaphobacter lichenicola]|uniref:Uncharacterized protein n=1 Tax=Tunturiibacter gelidiferens TaxID=3069689 RepID=A0ACC5NTG8_9BACT|nr:hypothetical protein [Edaphobacter lichenicola]